MLYPSNRHTNLYLQALLETYLGSDVADYVLERSAEPAKRIYATVLFADIRDFTAMAEVTDEAHLYDEVNAYYAIIDEVIKRYGGVVNDFGGDSILALFGAPYSLADHAAAALHAAADIMDELADLNKERESESRPPLRVGIGVNSGNMMMGNVGSATRKTFTVLGDCVNSAKRLSDMSKENPFYSIYASQQTVSDVHSGLPVSWELFNLGEKRVRGRQQSLITYAIMPDAPA